MHNTKKNLFFIKKLYLLIKNNDKKQIPIAALIVNNHKVISIAKNNLNNIPPFDHAESLAIKMALQKNSNLSESILYTSLEPCLMCTGLAINTNIKIIYYACQSQKSGIHTQHNIKCIPNIAIIPILKYNKKIAMILKNFFQNK